MYARPRSQVDLCELVFNSHRRSGSIRKDAAAYYIRGLVYKDKGDPDRAIADYDQTIRLDSAFTAAYTGRGLAYEGKGDHARAPADSTPRLRFHRKATRRANLCWPHHCRRQRPCYCRSPRSPPRPSTAGSCQALQVQSVSCRPGRHVEGCPFSQITTSPNVR